VTDTREAIDFDREGAAPLQAPRDPLSLRPAAPAARRGLAASAHRAFDDRRLFVLIPFAIITGLIASTAAGTSPEPWALVAAGAALAGAIILARATDVALRSLVLLAAFWLGFTLLAIHGALFGTAMLSRSAYGTYAARQLLAAIAGEPVTHLQDEPAHLTIRASTAPAPA